MDNWTVEVSSQHWKTVYLQGKHHTRGWQAYKEVVLTDRWAACSAASHSAAHSWQPQA